MRRSRFPSTSLMEAVPRKPSDPDRGYGFHRERIDVAERDAEEIAGIAEAQNGAPAILNHAIHPQTALQHMKDVPGRISFPEDRAWRRERLGGLRMKECAECRLCHSHSQARASLRGGPGRGRKGLDGPTQAHDRDQIDETQRPS